MEQRNKHILYETQKHNLQVCEYKLTCTALITETWCLSYCMLPRLETYLHPMLKFARYYIWSAKSRHKSNGNRSFEMIAPNGSVRFCGIVTNLQNQLCTPINEYNLMLHFYISLSTFNIRSSTNASNAGRRTQHWLLFTLYVTYTVINKKYLLTGYKRSYCHTLLISNVTKL